MRRRLSLGALLAATLALAAAPAHADVFGPIGLLDAGTIGGGEMQQAEYAHAAELSSDGRYLVFEGSVGGEAGIWRESLATRQLQEVAGGEGVSAGSHHYAARFPSISADGRYVSFTSNEGREQLAARTRGLAGEAPTGAPAEEPGSDQVYVRDMEAQPTQPEAFVVASAVNGSSAPLTYSESDTQHGSVAAAGSAISANGQDVAFVTTAVSNLAGERTPALQVAVRRLARQETILVSGEYEASAGATSDRPVSGEGFGAVYVRQKGVPSPLPEVGPEYSGWREGAHEGERPPGASISADGSTVAWMGQNIASQARMLPGEQPKPGYSEPLWRRLEAPATATERVTGGSDPSNAACAESGQSSLPMPPTPGDPCQGPFVTFPGVEGNEVSGIFSSLGHAEGHGDAIPRLSGDGWTVAFLSRAEPVAALVAGGPFTAERAEGEPADLYVASMRPGPSRAAATATITALGGESAPETEAIEEFALSEDGSHVAFTTRRTQFRLADPAYVSPAAGEVGLNEAYDVDLADGTLTRVTHGPNGEPSEQLHNPKEPGQETAYNVHPSAGATSPSYAQDGALLAFCSTASNLVAGDGNNPLSYNQLNVGEHDGSDAFVVAREAPSALPTPQTISPPPAISTEPAWDLSATALARSDGSVVIYVRTPGAGTLRASASASVLAGVGAHGSRRKRRSSRSSARRATALRTVASAAGAARAQEGELVALVLRPAAAYASLAQRAGGLSANVTLRFSALGRPPLSESLPVTFLSRAHAARRVKHAHGAKKPKRGGR